MSAFEPLHRNPLIGHFVEPKRGEAEPHKVNDVMFHAANGRWLLLLVSPTGELHTMYADECRITAACMHHATGTHR